MIEDQSAIIPAAPELPQKSFPLWPLIALLSFFLGIVSVLAYQNFLPTRTVPVAPSLSPVAAVSPQPSADLTAGWIVYQTQDHDVKLEFKVPQSWKDQYGSFVEQSSAGEKGIQFCLSMTKKSLMEKIIKPVSAGGGACDIEWFGFGGLSQDYEAGRGGGFSDTNGFIVENNRYYYLTILNRKIDITPYIVESYINPNGINFLIIKGIDETGVDVAGIPVIGTPGSKKIGALVNLTSGRIAGLAVEMNSTLGDEKLFKQILSTLKFTGGSQTCQYQGKTYQDGETFSDKCNFCSCDSGQIACTTMACED